MAPHQCALDEVATAWFPAQLRQPAIVRRGRRRRDKTVALWRQIVRHDVHLLETIPEHRKMQPVPHERSADLPVQLPALVQLPANLSRDQIRAVELMRLERSAHRALEDVAPAERGHLDYAALRAGHVGICPEASHRQRLDPGRTRQEQRPAEAGVRNGGSIERIGVGLIGRPAPDLVRPRARSQRDQLPNIDRRWQ